jgi:RNA polymerase sigma-70 factor, ECF subfamily
MTQITMKATTYPEEAGLVEKAKDDPVAFGALYDRYVERIYSYAYRETRNEASAQDITAITFEKVLRNLKQFRWREMGFAPWLYRIARNEIAQYYRRESRMVPLVSESDNESTLTAMIGAKADHRPIESSILSSEQNKGLHDALGRLSLDDREVLTLRFLEQLPTDDVARILNCSRNALYVRLHRALGRLRMLLEAEGEVEHDIK